MIKELNFPVFAHATDNGIDDTHPCSSWVTSSMFGMSLQRIHMRRVSMKLSSFVTIHHHHEDMHIPRHKMTGELTDNPLQLLEKYRTWDFSFYMCIKAMILPFENYTLAIETGDGSRI